MRDDTPVQFDEDVGLMLKVKMGDQQAYTRLYEKYVPLVRRYLARRHGRAQHGDDLAQEVFTRIWCRRGRYQPLASVKSYLLGVAANVLREDRAKSRGRIPLEACDPEAMTDTSQPSPPAQAQSREQLHAVHALMATLPARQRQALELVYLAGLAPDEAARRLGCSLQTFHSHLCAGRQRLRELARRSQEK